MKSFILFFFAWGLSMAVVADDQAPPNVKNLMTAEDFSASGLEKLSDAERAHLSEWVARYREGALVGPAVPKTPSQRAEEKKIEIAAKVVPKFVGWSGKTIFQLDNGQIWEQRIAGKLHYSGEDSTVVISANMLGKYVLTHEATGRSVGVKLIK